MNEEKKYEILPGVETPDIKTINDAASDFSISEVANVEIKSIVLHPVTESAVPDISSADLADLQKLGDKVAADEERSRAVSRAKMDKNLSRVMAPESIGELKASHIAQLNEEKRKELEERSKEAEKQQAEVDAKTKAREERRILQQRIFEEAKQKAEQEKAKAAKEAEEKAKAEAEKQDEVAPEVVAAVEKVEEKIEEKVEAPVAQQVVEKTEEKPEEKSEAAAEAKEEPVAEAAKPAEPAAPAVPQKRTTKVVSSEEAFDDFKEFL